LEAEMKWFQWQQSEQYLSKAEQQGSLQEAIDA